MDIKKLIALLAATSTLAACQTDDTTDPAVTDGDETEETGEDIDTQEEEAELDDDPSEVVVSDEELEPVSDEDLENAEPIEDLDQYEEFEEQDVFSPEDYDAYLISDEGGVREIIFVEEEEQVFKSIFIMEDNNLRVIDLINSEVLINDPI
ncbi:hypothetical protein [Alkalibacterium olivapovliticus]|uniref:Uncharacterized protein n=1 Tax=Alkalibacterium olivapovliticus TaxID=99907 RepID=A0A2T0VUH2_9LACT|nr:hypothetical protein [Alkalibacterium olivapovliticus]PRY75175.1 hypothetical protein CLV38_1366 [Alkalibacterium olivapovliticus]